VTASSLTYLFCLVRSTKQPAVAGVVGTSARGAATTGPLARLPGAGELRVIPAGRATWLIVASVPARQYSEAALAKGLKDLDWVGQRAMAHEAIVEHFLSAPAVLPMQLFTLFTSDERAVAHVDATRRQIERILKRIDRQHEWGLRLTWDEKSVREKIEQRAAARPAATGSAYLTLKRDRINVTRVQLTEAKAKANRLYRALSREATEARRRTSLERAAPGSRLLLDAAFLVPVKRAMAFRAALRTLVRGLGPSGIVVSLTGPWPPYNFI
jgi:hypothetical protein